jgi:hypothetical protein
MSKYIKVPETITINKIEQNNFSLSAPQYKTLLINNSNVLSVRNFLERDLKRSDLGIEVGSSNYIDKSNKYFLRTKALQKHTFLPEINKRTAKSIYPKVFKSMNLKEGDLIISKDSNIGEIIILDKDYPDYMLSGALYKLPVKNEYKYYLLAFIKHTLFREQLDFMVPSGVTIRHAKKMFLDCKIPIPNKNKEKTMKYVSVLTQAIINKEKAVKERHQEILNCIQTELSKNQKTKKFNFQYPTFNEMAQNGRMDTNLYQEKFKINDFLIKNYKNGFQTIYDFGFKLSRGQNLQVSNIGKSIYSDKYLSGFYSLMLPKHLSKYGIIDTKEYIGNPKQLKTLKQGDLIFGAEGFEKGRSIVIIEDKEKTITNIHGITIQQDEKNLTKSIFIKSMLDYLRHKEIIDLFAVGGNGGSLAQKYWRFIPFPKFKESKQLEISKLYHNPLSDNKIKSATTDNFLKLDNKFNQQVGIYELDKTAKYYKELLNEVIDKIVNDKIIKFKF